jgi:uncharacterized membrane protein
MLLEDSNVVQKLGALATHTFADLTILVMIAKLLSSIPDIEIMISNTLYIKFFTLKCDKMQLKHLNSTLLRNQRRKGARD